MTTTLPQMKELRAYRRLRSLQQKTRRAKRAALILFICNLLAVLAYAFLLDLGRFFYGG